MAVFVTGDAGFIGSQFVRDWVERYPSKTVINFDKLTHAGNLENLSSVASHPSYRMIPGDICDAAWVSNAKSGEYRNYYERLYGDALVS